MATTADRVIGQSGPPGARAMPPEIPLSMLVNFVLAAACIYLSSVIFGLDDFGRLGRPVQVFVALVVLLPGALAVYSSLRLWQGKAAGRFSALAIQYVGCALSVVMTLHFWGFFLSFETFIDTVMANAPLTLGFALAYALYWFAGRLHESNPLQGQLTNVALLLGVGTLVLLLLLGNALGAANAVLSTYGNLGTWIATISAIVFGVLAWRMLKLDAYFGETPAQSEAWQGWMMLSPNIIGFALFFAGPLLLSFYLSFTDSTVGQVPNVIGLSNYAEIFSVEFQWKDDPNAYDQSVMSFGFTPLGAVQMGDRTLVVGAKDVLFWLSLRNTLAFCLMLVPLSVIPALGLSLILNSKLPGVKVFRAIYFLPSVAAVVGTALIWRWLYDPIIGFFNYTITQITTFFGLPDPQIQWLTSPALMLVSVVILAAWQVVGFNTVLFLAGLQGIPRELYEAAMIDGAARWGQFRWVTLPMLAPTTFFVMITTVITGLQVFNEPYTLFTSVPIPQNVTTAVYYLYNQGFFRFEFGYASAIAWVLFAIIFTITLVQFRLGRSNAYEN